MKSGRYSPDFSHASGSGRGDSRKDGATLLVITEPPDYYANHLQGVHPHA
jgi:hypothetical protein